MTGQDRRSVGLTDDQLCKDRPCTCGAFIHDPVHLAWAARLFRKAHARVDAKRAAEGGADRATK